MCVIDTETNKLLYHGGSGPVVLHNRPLVMFADSALYPVCVRQNVAFPAASQGGFD